MITRRPRAVSSWPRLDAVSPLPKEEATPPVTKTCLVARVCTDTHGNTAEAIRAPDAAVRLSRDPI